MDYLSLCLICKDENDYLPEWLDYHLLLGVDRIYVYDNDSRVPITETLAEYISRGRVIVNKIAGRSMQLPAYDHCLQTYGKHSTWIGFIDTDEFLVPKTCLDLKVFLKDYAAFAGLAVSSFFFGSNGHQHRPGSGQLSAYTKSTHETFFENNLVKSIVQPARVLLPMSPHDFIYQPGEKCVNENFRRVDSQHYPHSSNRIQLNHYFCRSREELDQKLARGRGQAIEPWRMERFTGVDQRSVYPNLSALQTIEKKLQLNTGNTALKKGKNAGLAVRMHTCVQSMPALPIIPPEEDLVIARDEIIRQQQVKDALLLLQGKNDYPAIKDILLEIQRSSPDSILAYTDLAKTALWMNDPDFAWQVLAKAWKIAPDSLPVREYMTYYFLRTANYAMAEKTARLYLELAPNDLQAMGFLTDSLLGLGRVEDALKIGIPVVELSLAVGELPEKMDTYLLGKLAGCLLEKKDYNRAVKLWETVIASRPQDITALLELSRCLILAGDRSRARQIFSQAGSLSLITQKEQERLQELEKQLFI